MLSDYKTALVTGGSSGIGMDAALALADRGIKVVILGRDAEKMEKIKSQSPDLIFPVACNVRDYNSVREAVQQAAGILGTIDILINSAGVSMREFVKTGSVEVDEFNKLVDTNLKGVFYICREVLPHMEQAGRGYVINILSTAAYAVRDGNTPYSASKYGARAITETIRLEYEPYGIRVSSVSPGAVNTNIWSHKKVVPDEAKRKTFMKPEVITQSILYLLELPEEVIVDNILVKPSAVPRKENQS